MNKIAIFGMKGSIAKYDLTENKPLWVGNIASGYKPNIIGQYEDYLIVFSSVWTGSKMIHCFDQNNGEKLWSHNQEILHSSMIPFIPHTFEDHMYYMASSKEVAKLSWKTGELVYRKRFKKSFLNQYSLVIVSDEVLLVSKKDAFVVNKQTGDIQPYNDLSEQLNLKEISAMLGNGVSFMSSIYLTHPQPYTDGGTYGGDAGGGGAGE
mgnify:FL=1